ncbi:unnamed protein product [Phaeothamnion confervicola]
MCKTACRIPGHAASHVEKGKFTRSGHFRPCYKYGNPVRKVHGRLRLSPGSGEALTLNPNPNPNPSARTEGPAAARCWCCTQLGGRTAQTRQAKAGKVRYWMQQRLSVELENAVSWQVEEVFGWAMGRRRDLAVLAAEEEALHRHALGQDVLQEPGEAGDPFADLLRFGGKVAALVSTLKPSVERSARSCNQTK